MAEGESHEAPNEACSRDEDPVRDPRTIARRYQLMLCKKAIEKNIIVYLGTGCGKTLIAVLLIYELGHLIRKPLKSVCIFLAPTVHLVQQQAMVIENSTNFKVGRHFGNSKRLKSHPDWEREIEQLEVLVMTPQILLHNLEHCFIRMEFIALLIFDECHHAQTQNRHPYAQIMKEFYKASTTKRPRIFGMTASPIIGKGGSNEMHFSKSINSLEDLLDAEVCSVDDNEELESLVASPNTKIYYYGPVVNSASSSYLTYGKNLETIKNQCISMIRRRVDDPKSLQKKIKLISRLHENLIFCLENLGIWGATQAARILLSGDHFELNEMMESEGNPNNDFLSDIYLNQAVSVCNSYLMEDDDVGFGSFHMEALEEPFFSKKLLLLIGILSSRLQADVKCIVFVKRIIIARSLAFILGNIESLNFWKCEFLVGFHSGLKKMSRKMMNGIVDKFRSGKVNLLVATNVAEEGLDIQTCCLVVRFDLPESVTSFIQSRGRARMQQSEYVFLVERDNQRELKLIKDFMSDEECMDKQITCRTSIETFVDLEEKRYQVDSTGASISTGSSVSLLHHYCSKLPKDEHFSPKPEFFYFDDSGGTVCRIILPPNAPIRQIDSLPCPSKDEAKRIACLKACTELHARGALTNYLLPGSDDDTKEEFVERTSESGPCEEDNLRGELHEMLIPAALRVPWTCTENPIRLYFYDMRFIPDPDDRLYRDFGLFVKNPLPKEAETMNVDLHLAHGRIVKTQLNRSGIIEFDADEITHAQNFQEMFLKIILDRSEFVSNFVPLGKKASSHLGSSTFYLLLPIRKHEHEDKMIVDWRTVKGCLSSPVFRCPTRDTDKGHMPVSNSLEFFDGPIRISDIPNSLVLTPHNKLLFFIVDILHGTNGNSQLKGPKVLSYAEHYEKKFSIHLLYPEQPLLKAKQLFSLHNLLHNRLQENTEVHELEEHFVELPPELCSLKILGFSKDIGSTLSLLPSIMHRLENLLVAIELKDMLSISFPEGSEITASLVLQALTTEKCLERFSLERLEVLGDVFLKYVVSRHVFLSYESLDEGQLTRKRSSIVNNSHLYELAIRKKLQVYIRDEWFDPRHFFALGRPCNVICNKDTEKTVHFQRENGNIEDGADAIDVKCSKRHHWLQRKTIADVVEALVGAFIIDSGFMAATAFLKWIGIQVNFEVSDLSKVYIASKSNMSLIECIDIAALEKLLGYKFLHKGLLLQAFIHPSYNKHSGGCYQRLEFLGDALLDYLITSYLYSVYPDLKPGQLTDLRSITVNNDSFAYAAVRKSFHSYLISDSYSLSEAINKFVSYVQSSNSKKDLLMKPKCEKVLGDLVESCAGAVLLDSGFDLNLVWRIMFTFLEPVMSFSALQLSPIRELQELCQHHNFKLQFQNSKTDRGNHSVEAVLDLNGTPYTSPATINRNKTVAKRMAAEKALSELKARGFKHKNKSLEEILQSSRMQEAKLIGYDEIPANIDATNAIQLEELRLGDTEPATPSPPSNSSTRSRAKTTSKEEKASSSKGKGTAYSEATSEEYALKSVGQGHCETNKAITSESGKPTAGSLIKLLLK
ncbi:dicer-like 4 isoform X2 [Tasmannia lanceolata]|uniref:dicer-like 4 isoform X2 n=1 Tax=Tasmannia lanceolata TaxID=3420 RepID=UPI0040634DD6